MSRLTTEKWGKRRILQRCVNDRRLMIKWDTYDALGH